MRFFDFCSGIGAGRIGLERNGFECIGHSEIDETASQTYNLFFNDDRNYGDLTKLNIDSLPDFDFLIAGFPCQTFSIVGNRQGFNDSRGQIIYHLIEIIKAKNIKYFLLENVKGLVNHNKGNTLDTIIKLLDGAGYNTYYQILNSIDFGVPQMRERVYIVGFRKDLDKGNFVFPKGRRENLILEDFLDKDNNNELDIENPTFNKYLSNKYNKNKYSKSDILQWDNFVVDWRQSDLRRYKNCFPTLRTGRHGLLYIKNAKIKKLNGYEALLLQGFPKDIAQKVKEDKFFVNNKVLSQAGNAMTVNVIESIVKNMVLSMESECE